MQADMTEEQGDIIQAQGKGWTDCKFEFKLDVVTCKNNCVHMYS